MFRNRKTSQKPTDELYQTFKANFSALKASGVSSTDADADADAPGQTTLPATSLAETLDVPLNPRSLDDQTHDIKDADPTPRGSNEPWTFGTSGLTPSLMDPSSHNFNMFAGQMPGYYTPPPGGNALFHSQAGDLHTPSGFGGLGLGTPLSMPTSESGLHAGQQATQFHGFQAHLPQHIQPHQFHNVNPFHMHQQQGFPPQQFSHQPSFDTMEGPVGQSPVDDMAMDLAMQHPHQGMDGLFHTQSLQGVTQPPSYHPSAEKFRYHVTLNAPTAMVKHADEIPVTYLNKGQAYTLNVIDTNFQQGAPGAKYRTFVRVSFEDEQQRQKPAACWQLWKEGRGTNEAHQRGGRLQAVEYVDAGQLGGSEEPGKAKVDLECASFDGFCVTWSPAAGAAECPISVRFNFLSTDFSHSKGVKGIPVRLCAKTELLDEGSDVKHTHPLGGEVCYCKVKLFRDHGAERKLSNDVAHVKKTIDKLNQQIAQIESGMRDSGKRKRSGSMAKGIDSRPEKVPKHRRTWSMASGGSSSGRGSAEDDMHVKLLTLQDMFTSTRPASVLYLGGEEEDDPDAHPVKLTGEDNIRTDSIDASSWEKQSGTGPPSSAVSPTPSSDALIGSRKDASMQQPTPIGGPSRENSSEWKNKSQMATTDTQTSVSEQLHSPPDNLASKVETRSPISGALSGWIEALGVDHGYRPPPERHVKPVVSIFVQPRVAGKAVTDNYYRAVYLMNRTLRDFNNAIATKCGIEPTAVLRTYRINRDGLHILFDDDCIRELRDAQDMTAEFCEIRPDTPIRHKREWVAGSTDIQCDGDLSTIENVNSTGYELKLLF